MTDQATLISRIGGWFKRGQETGEPAQDVLPIETTDIEATMSAAVQPVAIEPPVLAEPPETRSTFIRPWAKREATVEQLQNGVGALTDLLESVRDNLDRNSKRQDEMMGYLTHLPQALKSIPETGRVQGETLKTIQKQIERQNTQQAQVTQVLERISRSDDREQRALETIQERIESVNRSEHAMSESLGNVGMLLQTMSKHSEASAQVLVGLRDGMVVRDRNVEKILHRQGIRFTTMLVIAIFLSMAALVSVGIFGYLGYDVLSHVGK